MTRNQNQRRFRIYTGAFFASACCLFSNGCGQFFAQTSGPHESLVNIFLTTAASPALEKLPVYSIRFAFLACSDEGEKECQLSNDPRDPRRSVAASLRLALDVNNHGVPSERPAMVAALSQEVGLDPDLARCAPSGLSAWRTGGTKAHRNSVYSPDQYLYPSADFCGVGVVS